MTFSYTFDDKSYNLDLKIPNEYKSRKTERRNSFNFF